MMRTRDGQPQETLNRDGRTKEDTISKKIIRFQGIYCVFPKTVERRPSSRFRQLTRGDPSFGGRILIFKNTPNFLAAKQNCQTNLELIFPPFHFFLKMKISVILVSKFTLHKVTLPAMTWCLLGVRTMDSVGFAWV